MANLALFLDRLFREGTLRVEADRLTSDAGVRQVLERAFDVFTLDLAGPRLECDFALSAHAGKILYELAWYFTHPAEDGRAAESRFRWEIANATIAQHVSVDLVFRYLPTLYRRVRAIHARDFLTPVIENLLRSWPLSGVLSEVAEPPLHQFDFSQHLGVAWWYAERWAKLAKPSWLPEGNLQERAELVWQAIGRDVATMPSPTTNESP